MFLQHDLIQGIYLALFLMLLLEIMEDTDSDTDHFFVQTVRTFVVCGAKDMMIIHGFG